MKMQLGCLSRTCGLLDLEMSLVKRVQGPPGGIVDPVNDEGGLLRAFAFLRGRGKRICHGAIESVYGVRRCGATN
jgi:hypothetical protein